MTNLEPNFQDEVKHKNNDAFGTVIAKYPIDNKQYIDVRLCYNRIYYKSPAENWLVVKPYVE